MVSSNKLCMCLLDSVVSCYFSLLCSGPFHAALHPHTLTIYSKTQNFTLHANNVAPPRLFLKHLLGALLKCDR